MKERSDFLHLVSQVPKVLRLVSSLLKTQRTWLTFLASLEEDTSMTTSSFITVNISILSSTWQSSLVAAIVERHTLSSTLCSQDGYNTVASRSTELSRNCWVFDKEMIFKRSGAKPDEGRPILIAVGAVNFGLG
jgi:alanine racemase